MKVSIARLCCLALLLFAGITGYTQTKPAPKSKPATSKPAPSANNKNDQKPGTTAPPEESQATPNLPPLPDIDTTAAPDDELTREIKKMLVMTNAQGAATQAMKTALDLQRKNVGATLPAEFYDRFNQAIDNGEISHLLELVAIKIYREKFTVDDIKEINKFYATAAGKKMAAELPYITSKSQEEGMKIGQYMALKIARDLMQEGKLK
jgi:hypothetical protein